MATNIYIPVNSSGDDEVQWIHALAVPHQDIRRLSLRPLKWLRFATFSVCGVEGDFAATSQDGEMTVDPENVSFDNLADTYYYVPRGEYHLVDHHAFNDRTSTIGDSDVSRRAGDFRHRVRERDGHRCVFTRKPAPSCDATHIIPRSKGSRYITTVVQKRAILYETSPFLRQANSGDIDIDCVQNGILLRTDLHKSFGLAEIAFLKTPNFALSTADIPIVNQGYTPSLNNRMTIQSLIPESGTEFFVVPQVDAQPSWSDEETSPPSILLDFMFGAAVLKHWMSGELIGMLDERFERDFAGALEERSERSNLDSDNDDIEAPPDDPRDVGWQPSQERKYKKRKRACLPSSTGLSVSMDRVLALSTLLTGGTPQAITAEQERRGKEKEQQFREHGRNKVEQWLSGNV